MTNSELRDYTGTILSGLEKQRQVILREYSVQQPCPSCGTQQNVFELLRIDIDDYSMGGHEPIKGECIGCERELELVVPFMKIAGPHWDWRLIPVEPTKVQHGAS